ncbi:MAG: RagB/SusD family nutrient uptake outer membrane protein [Pedobacter sp.]|nr:MAG: RagB/SusD family nutrient uptake outer membrane protein [Pedobacter sp.]
MKTTYTSFLAVALLLTVSCKKELYKDPIGLLTPAQVNTDPKANTLTSSVNSSYQMLSNTLNLLGQWDWAGGTVFRNDFIVQDIASDDAMKKWASDGDQAWMDEVDNFRFISTNQAFNGIWSYDYEGISRTNLALSYLTDDAIVTKVGLSAAIRNRSLGEAYFLRAYYYFDLVNNFGDVPVVLKPLANFTDAYGVAKRVPKAQVWDQINADLTKAKALLPASKFSDATDKWRVSKGAVIALQAKSALYNEKYSDVISLVNELQTLNFYSLNANYFDSFDQSKEFADNEVIFAYDHQSGKTPKNGNGYAAPLGWGFFAPTANFIAAFEQNDPRLGYTVDVSKQNIYKLLGDKTGANKGNDDAGNNKIYIRYADVLLWKAEALNETGDTQGAVAIINQVRTRARNTVTITGTTAPAGTLPDRPASTDKAVVKNWLMQERRVELGLESQRFLDLKRWKTAKAVLTAQGKNFQDKNYLYPIPQGDIDKSGGTITQNTGY